MPELEAIPSTNSHSNASVNVSSGTLHNIDRLCGENYVNWKFAMKMVLQLEGLWQCVLGTETDKNKEARALARICLSIQPNLYQYVRDCDNAKDAWSKLADAFENKGLYRKVLLLRHLHRIEYTQFPSMSDYIEGVMKIVHQLEDIGKKIDDGEVAEILLSGLGQEFDIIVSSLETACLTNQLSSELVRARLLQDASRKRKERKMKTTRSHRSTHSLLRHTQHQVLMNL